MEEKTYTLPNGDEVMVIFGFVDGEEKVVDIYCYNDCDPILISLMSLNRPSRKGSPFIHSTNIEDAWNFVQEFGMGGV